MAKNILIILTILFSIFNFCLLSCVNKAGDNCDLSKQNCCAPKLQCCQPNLPCEYSTCCIRNGNEAKTKDHCCSGNFAKNKKGQNICT
ncbi:hypothetical protein ACQ4LE_000354 [Meloidogyne hapla]